MEKPFVQCAIDGCCNNAHWRSRGAKGMCSMHYTRMRIHGDPSINKLDDIKSKASSFKRCIVDGCERNASGKSGGKAGLCSMHYKRKLKHGDPLFKWQKESPAIDWINKHKNWSEDECLVWPFHIGRDGYGRAHHPERKHLSTASHIMCELAHGPRPSSRHEAAHSCGRGNQGCVNPMHLYWATPTENQRDRVSHGTSNRGEQQWRARITADDVRAIRAMSAASRVCDIAMAFGLHQSYVSQIIHRKRWAWLP